MTKSNMFVAWSVLLLLLTLSGESCLYRVPWHPGLIVGYLLTNFCVNKIPKMLFDVSELGDGAGVLGFVLVSLILVHSPGIPRWCHLCPRGRPRAMATGLLCLCVGLFVQHVMVVRQSANEMVSEITTAFGVLPDGRSRTIYDPMAHASNSLGRSNKLVPSRTLAYKTIAEEAPSPCYDSVFCHGVFNGFTDAWTGPELELDVYLPENSTRAGGDGGLAPVFMHVHGGGWKHGSRRFIQHSYRGGLPASMLKLGGVVVSVSYRLSRDGWKGEHMLQDLRDALTFIKLHAKEWGGDPHRIIPWGTSAGGHLSTLLAYTAHDPSIVGVMPLYGIYEIRRAELRKKTTGLAGFMDRTFTSEHAIRELCTSSSGVAEAQRTPRDQTQDQVSLAAQKADEECQESFSPLAHVRRGSPPTLLIHGQNDALVPVHQAEMLQGALRSAGVPHVLVSIPCGDHDCDTRCSSPCSQAAMFALEHFLHFLNKGARLQ